MSQLNIAFDGRSLEALFDFIAKNRDILISGKIHIKLNDLFAEIGSHGLKDFSQKVRNEIGIDIPWMIDGKWHDIPNTVAHYVKRLDGLTIAYYTVHASGGGAMIRAAKQAAPEKKLLAITILTSMSEAETYAIYDENRNNSILRLAREALSAGADGLVCSPSDVAMLRSVFREMYGDFLLVTPNIQQTGIARNDDQNRALTMTPKQAIANGATDIVVGRPILNAEDPTAIIESMLREMDGVEYKKEESEIYRFEKLLHTGNWESLLKGIGAIYRKPEHGKFVRLTSGFLSDTYINIGATERDYRVLSRASNELVQHMKQSHIEADIIMGAQMGSVRLSAFLAKSMGICESVYTEKDGDTMALKRHDLGKNGLMGKRVILSEDVITKGSTIAKMIEIVKQGGGEVVAITCVVNRSGKESFTVENPGISQQQEKSDTDEEIHSFSEIPLFHCYVPPTFGMWWDEKTIEKTRANSIAANLTAEQIA